MKVARRYVAGVLMALSLFATGCGPGPKDQEIQSLRERLTQAENDLQERDNRLRALQAERDELAQRNAALDRQLKDALAAGGAGEGTKLSTDFTGFGNFAYADISEDILFDSGRAIVKEEGRRKLTSIVEQIRKLEREKFNGAASVFVIGHTDTDPISVTKDKWIDNLDLSVNRGASVTRELQRLGIEPARVVAAGQGEHNPRVSNDSKAAKSQNRRVQIILAPKLRASGEGARGTATPRQ